MRDRTDAVVRDFCSFAPQTLGVASAQSWPVEIASLPNQPAQRRRPRQCHFAHLARPNCPSAASSLRAHRPRDVDCTRPPGTISPIPKAKRGALHKPRNHVGRVAARAATHQRHRAQDVGRRLALVGRPSNNNPCYSFGSTQFWGEALGRYGHFEYAFRTRSPLVLYQEYPLRRSLPISSMLYFGMPSRSQKKGRFVSSS